MVESGQFEFNMNNVYTDDSEDNNDRTKLNQVTQTVEPIDEGFDEEDDPDLDIPILDLVDRERGRTQLDSSSIDISDLDGTSDTEPETTTSDGSTSGTTLLNFSPRDTGEERDIYREAVNIIFFPDVRNTVYQEAQGEGHSHNF